MSARDALNILLVDDQPAKLLSYETILQSLGENLLKARSATEALECLLRHEVAVILVDVCMPDLDGYELARMIREHPRHQRTSIVFVSAVLMTDLDRLRGYQCGAVDYVPVPVIPEILRAKVSVFVDLYRKTQQLERLNRELEQRVADRTAALEASTAQLAERTAALEVSTAQLQEADKRKDEFIAMLAHELRNPLAPIRTAAQLMRLKDLPEARRDRAREMIERQIDHLVRLIDDLLDVSRITRGLITLQPKLVELGPIVSHAMETARPAIEARQQEMTVQMASEPIFIEGDPTRLAQAIGNVLHNAAKFTPDRGQISLRIGLEDGLATIRIKDTGVGIPAPALPQIFELFARGDYEAPATQPGLGIGLSLVRRFMEMHGGSVVAESEGPGLGSEFILRLPIVTERLALDGAARASIAPVSAGPPRKILVVDDNEDAAEAVSLLLRLAGHETRVEHDGLRALDAADEFHPDLVLLDLRMPNLDGYETARRLRQRPNGRQMALVALSGWSSERHRKQSEKAGFNAHLVKPVDQTELLKVVGDLSTRRTSRRRAVTS